MTDLALLTRIERHLMKAGEYNGQNVVIKITAWMRHNTEIFGVLSEDQTHYLFVNDLARQAS